MTALRNADVRVKLLCLAAYIAAALHARSAPALGVCLVTMVALSAVVRVEARSVRKALLALAPILLVTVSAQVLYLQQGEVLAQVGPIAVTSEALASSASMLAGLICVLGVSIAFMRCTGAEELSRAVGWLLAPLRHVGVHAGGFVFSLTTAFGFVPVLVNDFTQLKLAQQVRHASFDGTVRQRLSAYAHLFPPLVRIAFRRADNLAESATSRCLTREVVVSSLYPSRFAAPEVLMSVVTAVAVIAVLVLG